MNPHTGHLVEFNDEEMQRQLENGYEPLPDKLVQTAEKVLDGKKETYVDLRAASPLANWAKKKRKEKIAAKSKRINRRR